ncbi:MAG: response regulator, partial [Desulfovibrionales bacterium]|nr:response regulator [Desulfovibrionales bacterium]
KKILSFHPQVRVNYASTAKLSHIKGSTIHLQKTVMNLIANAAEAQSQGGIIKISTSNRFLDHPIKGYDQVQPGHYVVLGVEDHGVGIDPEDIKRIFEPFFTKKVMGRSGTGLGMAVVWGTVQDHFGYIDVISQPGKGTRFDLYFPTTHSSVPLEAIPDETHYFMGNREIVIVVDDIPDQREIASKILERLNYTVMAFECGEDLMVFLENHRADLILLDMVMEPGMDGLKTYEKILEIVPDQKVIITSGFSKIDKMSKALEMGVNQYLKKPYTLEKISSAIYHVLQAEVTT